jgi:hypothetical protein
MSTFYDCYQSVAAAWELNERIIHHCQPGGILAGLKYDKEGTFKVDGEDDLPLLQPWSIDFTEAYFAGGPKLEHNGVPQGNQPTADALTLTFRLAVSRRAGWFRRDPTSSSAKKGLLEWISLIRDAIEIKNDGSIDARLNLGIVRPVLTSIGDTNTTELSFQCFFEVRLDIHPTYRGERRLSRPRP